MWQINVKEADGSEESVENKGGFFLPQRRALVSVVKMVLR